MAWLPTELLMKNDVVLGVVRTQWEADGLVADLQGKGFSASDVHVQFPNDDEPRRTFTPKRRGKSVLFAFACAVLFTLAFGVVGFLVGMGEVTIPGLGGLVSAGPLTALYIGMGVGAVTGLLLGGLIGLARSSYQANVDLGSVQGGNILVSVRTEDAHQIEVATEIFVAHRAVGVSHRTEEIAVEPTFAVAATSRSPLGA
jgi:hypothetical protein